MSFRKFWPTWPTRSWLAQIASTPSSSHRKRVFWTPPRFHNATPFLRAAWGLLAPCGIYIYTAYCSNYPNRYPPLSTAGIRWHSLLALISLPRSPRRRRQRPAAATTATRRRPVFEPTAAALEVKCLTPTRRWHPMHGWLDPRCACGLINQAAVVSSSRSRPPSLLSHPGPCSQFPEIKPTVIITAAPWGEGSGNKKRSWG